MKYYKSRLSNKRFCVLLILILGFTCFFNNTQVYANDLDLKNIRISVSPSDVDITFDISWKNSWYIANKNHDAVWVFAKYKLDEADSQWRHMDINPNQRSPGTAAYAKVVIPDDAKGAFIERSSGKGIFESENVTLSFSRPNFTSEDEMKRATIGVFSIEMVYVPTGDFYLGDGENKEDISKYAFCGYEDRKRTYKPAHITKDPANVTFSLQRGRRRGPVITIDGDDGIGFRRDSHIQNPDYPTGYKAFYIMKYEISQGQYRDFLNTLTQAQQNANIRPDIDLSQEQAEGFYVMALSHQNTDFSFRNRIRAGANPRDGRPYRFGCDYSGDMTFDEPDDGEWIACNMLSWQNILAYADWAGLRPMTEFEFEKAARGSKSPVLGEYAWGSRTITKAEIIVDGTKATSDEIVEEQGNGVCNYGISDFSVPAEIGPLRCGFAAQRALHREAAGASCWGIMELTGNLAELCVSPFNQRSRDFNGSHGDGYLNFDGTHTNATWPDYFITRGGSWITSDENELSLSTRINSRRPDQDLPLFGGRLVRTEDER